MTYIQVRITDELHTALKKKQNEYYKPMTETIIELLERQLLIDSEKHYSN